MNVLIPVLSLLDRSKIQISNVYQSTNETNLLATFQIAIREICQKSGQYLRSSSSRSVCPLVNLL
jgi:hypothetical protein